MSQQSVNFEIPLKVIGPDGTVLWQGSGILGTVKTAICKVVAITAADAVSLDPGTFILQANNLAATATYGANVITARPCITTGSFDRGILGVAMNSAAIGEQVVIAGRDSLTTVKVAGATGTIGHYALPSATAGSVTSSQIGAVNPAEHVGKVVKPSGATAQPSATDTGVATRMGIIVDPSSDNIV